jgi:hypothetical protein
MVFTDPYTAAEAERALSAMLADPGVVRPLGLLVDARYGSAPSPVFVESFVASWERQKDEMRDARIAIVVANQGQREMAHMLEIMALDLRRLPLQVRTFRHPVGATGWLAEQPHRREQRREQPTASTRPASGAASNTPHRSRLSLKKAPKKLWFVLAGIAGTVVYTSARALIKDIRPSK